MEKPIHAVQRLEEAFRRLDWEGRAILGDRMCSICWSCHHLMAFGCRWSCDRCCFLQLLPGTIQWSDCSSGLLEVAFSHHLLISLVISLKGIGIRKCLFGVGMKFYLNKDKLFRKAR